MGGKGGGGSMPDAPDYMQLATLQADLDKKAALEQTIANRPNQINDQASLTWKRDPKTGKWTQTVSLDPRLKAQQDQVISQGGDLARQINAQGEFTGAPQIEWNPDAMKEYGDAIYGSVMDRAGVEQDRQRAALNTQLRQQGLQPGTEAYDRAMQNMMTSQGDVNTMAAYQATIGARDQYRSDYSAQLQGQDQNYAQDLQNYQMPWDLAGAAQGLTGGYRPTFDTVGTSTGYNPADMTGAAQAKYEARMGDYNAKQQSSGK